MSFGLWAAISIICSVVALVIWVWVYRIHDRLENILYEQETLGEWFKNILEASLEYGPGIFVLNFALVLCCLALATIAGPVALLSAVVYAVAVWLLKTMTK